MGQWVDVTGCLFYTVGVKSNPTQFFIMDCNCYVNNNGNDTYEVTLFAISRQDMIELANLLRNSSEYLRAFGLEIESELMEIRNN